MCMRKSSLNNLFKQNETHANVEMLHFSGSKNKTKEKKNEQKEKWGKTATKEECDRSTARRRHI